MRIIAIVIVACSAAGCAATKPRPAASNHPNDDALLVLPGLGYGRDGARSLRSLASAVNSEGFDLYVADYLTRGGLASSRARLQRYILENHLGRYQRLHVFAFIAGAWTINPLIEQGKVPNLGRVIYDRSPLQERAPAIAADRLRLLAWLRYGSTIFDIARSPYAPIDPPGIDVALVVESTATSFITHHAKAARALGPVSFSCDALGQRYDDCGYVALNHNELYTHFGDIWPELRTFLQTGRFSPAMNRTPPLGDPLLSKDRQ